MALAKAWRRGFADPVSPDVTPIPEELPSEDAASILCAVSGDSIAWVSPVI